MASQPQYLESVASIANALANGKRQLAATETARLDSELLLCHVLQVSRAYLYAHPDKRLDSEQQKQFDALIQRRLNHEPVAYLTGMREFWSLPLTVTRDTLVPRPETELLVEQVLLLAATKDNVHIADLGTGSGAIAIALASEIKTGRIMATENSAAALQVAAVNAEYHCPGRIEFRHGDWWEALAAETFDIIVSNPPYVEAADPALHSTELQHEPRMALAAGSDGLAALRILGKGAGRHLNAGGWLLLEHGADQARRLRQILDEAGFRSIRTHGDMSGLPRITMAQWPG